MHRFSLSLGVIFLVLGIILCYNFHYHFLGHNFFIISLILILLIIFRKTFLFSGILWTILGFIIYYINDKPIDNHYIKYKNTSLYEIQLVETLANIKSGKKRFIAEVKAVLVANHWHKTSGAILLYFPDNEQLKPNEILIAVLNPIKFKAPKYDFQFDYQAFMANKKIYYHASPKQFKKSKNQYFNLYAQVQLYRTEIIQLIDHKLGKTNAAGMLKTLLLGDKNAIAATIIDDYKQAGTLHLLAISGLHVMIIYQILWWLLRPIRYFPWGSLCSSLMLILFLILFSLITGLSASVCRASLMISLWELAKLGHRPQPNHHIISLSALILLVYNPHFLFDVGFQLSYIAVIFIALGYKPLIKLYLPKNKIIKLYYQSLLISLLATLGTFPFSLYYFHSFPSLFFISNLVLVPVFSFYLIFSILVLLAVLIDFPLNFIYELWNYAVWILNGFNAWIAQLQLQIEFIHFDFIKLIISILISLLTLVFIHFRKPIYINFIMGLVLLLSLYDLFSLNVQAKKSEIVTWDDYKNHILIVKKGLKAYCFFEKSDTINQKYLLVTYFSSRRISHYEIHTLYGNLIKKELLKKGTNFIFENKKYSINDNLTNTNNEGKFLSQINQ